MDDLQRLLAVEEIKKLKARYFRNLDAKDWDGFASLFTEDIVFDFREAGVPPGLIEGVAMVEGAREAAEWADESIAGGTTLHQGHMPEIEIVDDETATGVWSLNDEIWYVEGSGAPYAKLEGYAYYNEEYKKVDDEWKISKLKFLRHRANWTEWDE